MPTWTYRCQACDAEVDVRTSLATRDEIKHEEHKTPRSEPCAGPLERLDQIEHAKPTPYAWQP